MGTSLKVLDRLILQVSLPTQGNFVTMAVVTDIRERVRITPSEATALGMKDGPNGPQWNPAADDPKPFDFTPAEYSLICGTLREFNDNNKLTIDHVGLYKAFLGEGKVLPFRRPEKGPSVQPQSGGNSGDAATIVIEEDPA